MNTTETNTLELELDIINILKSKNFTETEAVQIVNKLEKIQEYKIKASETYYKSAFQKDFARIDARLDKIDVRLDKVNDTIEQQIILLEEKTKSNIDQSKIDLLKWLFSFFVVLLAVMIIGIFFNK